MSTEDDARPSGSGPSVAVPVPLYRGREVGPPTAQKLPYPAEFWPGCPCKACVPVDADPFSFHAQMHLCPECGNKRCPGAADHSLACSGSNEPGQPGSLYENHPSASGKGDAA